MEMHETHPKKDELDKICYACLGDLFGDLYECHGPEGQGFIHATPSCLQHAEAQKLTVNATMRMRS